MIEITNHFEDGHPPKFPFFARRRPQCGTPCLILVMGGNVSGRMTAIVVEGTSAEGGRMGWYGDRFTLTEYEPLPRGETTVLGAL